MQPLLAIVGPTGSGKSSLALKLAERFSGEIVNCDSLQLYRGFDIGTAKTPDAERQGIAHHLFDVLQPGQTYSAGDYARQARAVVADISSRRKRPIVTGGTGFYLRALLDGLPALPARDEQLRTRLEERERKRPGALHRLLRRLDPDSAARIHIRDVHKLTRALEVRVLTRTVLPPEEASVPLDGYRALQIGLAPDRAQLHAVLEARARRMFRCGLVEEVRNLLASGCTGDEKPFESLGYKQTIELIRGRLSIEDAIASTIIETRQYAKRQMTWFRRDPRIIWIEQFGDHPDAAARSAELVTDWLRVQEF